MWSQLKHYTGKELAERPTWRGRYLAVPRGSNARYEYVRLEAVPNSASIRCFAADGTRKYLSCNSMFWLKKISKGQGDS